MTLETLSTVFAYLGALFVAACFLGCVVGIVVLIRDRMRGE